MRVRVYKSTGSWYIVKDEQGISYNARIKGKLKIDNITSTNPVAVGDYVNVESAEEDETVVITEILERKNYINRVSPHNKNQHHIVASNLDQTMLFATLREPKTSLGFIDRFLVTAEAYHVPAVIVINKIDLLKPKDQENLNRVISLYDSIGYKIIPLSLTQCTNIDELKNLLAGKTTLISGHSGVGKSTFINFLFPHLKLKTQDVSGWSGKGMHTTTFAEMFDLPDGGQIIDTPGIREMGLVDVTRYDLAHYFPEMRKLMHHCQFNDCLHVNEPGCAIKNAVGNDSIDAERYVNYLNILDSLEAKFY